MYRRRLHYYLGKKYLFALQYERLEQSIHPNPLVFLNVSVHEASSLTPLAPSLRNDSE